MKHRSFSFITGVMLVTTLAGCSLAQYETKNSAELAEPMATIKAADKIHDSSDTNESIDSDAPAFHFASGDLPLGDFDYEAIKDNLFDPCKEISAEEFAAVGFSSNGKTLRDEIQNLNACRLDSIENPSAYALLISGPKNRGEFRDAGLIVDENPSALIPQAYSSKAAKSEDNICYATVDTARGQLAVAIDDLFGDSPREALCSEAVQILESFYNINK